MIFYLILYISIYRQYLDNNNRIKNNLNNNIIEIGAYPGFVNCNINPLDDFHIKKFKEYYHIKEDTEIVVLKNNWKYYIFY